MKKTEIISIIKACQDGKKDSFAYIVEAFQEKIYRFCFHLLDVTEDARDATSEVFLKTFINLGRFDESQQFSSWLFRIAYNHCIDILRKEKRERKFLRSQFSSAISNNHRTPSIEDHYLESLEKEKLNNALRGLPSQYLTSLLLRYQFELSYAEIAKVMNKPISSVRILIFRAKKELRKIMGKGV
ncbi:MAG: hypothetical protein AMJ42_06050 [Deltaproteobacteria bacterium DG_8]|nr:MAG: hypothetical protein AMJ42_06050 [Deltaproteobacteria bacterium DG_8]